MKITYERSDSGGARSRSLKRLKNSILGPNFWALCRFPMRQDCVIPAAAMMHYVNRMTPWGTW